MSHDRLQEGINQEFARSQAVRYAGMQDAIFTGLDTILANTPDPVFHIEKDDPDILVRRINRGSGRRGYQLTEEVTLPNRNGGSETSFRTTILDGISIEDDTPIDENDTVGCLSVATLRDHLEVEPNATVCVQAEDHEDPLERNVSYYFDSAGRFAKISVVDVQDIPRDARLIPMSPVPRYSEIILDLRAPLAAVQRPMTVYDFETVSTVLHQVTEHTNKALSM